MISVISKLAYIGNNRNSANDMKNVEPNADSMLRARDWASAVYQGVLSITTN